MFATGVHDIRYIFAGDKKWRRQGEGKARVRVSCGGDRERVRREYVFRGERIRRG